MGLASQGQSTSPFATLDESACLTIFEHPTVDFAAHAKTLGERKRPLLPEIAWAQEHYSEVQAVDGSTLDALIRKIGLLKDLPQNPLAGRSAGLLNLYSRLPSQIWYESDPKAHDQRFWPQILAVLKSQALLIFDMGYINFEIFAQLTLAQVKFITRAKSNLVYTFERSLIKTATVRDSLVWIGPEDNRQLIRFVEVL